MTPVVGDFDNGNYQISVNDAVATVADLAGNLAPRTTFDLSIDESILGPPDSVYFSVSSLITF